METQDTIEQQSYIVADQFGNWYGNWTTSFQEAKDRADALNAEKAESVEKFGANDARVGDADYRAISADEANAEISAEQACSLRAAADAFIASEVIFTAVRLTQGIHVALVKPQLHPVTAVWSKRVRVTARTRGRLVRKLHRMLNA